VGGAPGLVANGNEKNKTRFYFNGWTEKANLNEPENVIFYVSYGILTYKRNSYIFLKRSTKIRLRMNENVMLETRRYILPKVTLRLQ